MVKLLLNSKPQRFQNTFILGSKICIPCILTPKTPCHLCITPVSNPSLNNSGSSNWIPPKGSSQRRFMTLENTANINTSIRQRRKSLPLKQTNNISVEIARFIELTCEFKRNLATLRKKEAADHAITLWQEENIRHFSLLTKKNERAPC